MLVQDPACGGQVVFAGAVRNHTGDRKVLYLDFESYEPMAKKVMQEICNHALEKWPIRHAVCHHRLGKLEISELAVVIAVSSPHRKAAFEACEFIIDELKKKVPIWKKEIFKGGEEWVSARP
ncbi:MAG: molybdenum cofactor biosynthesis protein MoaE [Flavobacteriales bacterium]|nr:molybdenum cofactor biosynthesis protein MoaE [Flavobacteriales bacterium]